MFWVLYLSRRYCIINDIDNNIITLFFTYKVILVQCFSCPLNIIFWVNKVIFMQFFTVSSSLFLLYAGHSKKPHHKSQNCKTLQSVKNLPKKTYSCCALLLHNKCVFFSYHLYYQIIGCWEVQRVRNMSSWRPKKTDRSINQACIISRSVSIACFRSEPDACRKRL